MIVKYLAQGAVKKSITQTLDFAINAGKNSTSIHEVVNIHFAF